MDLPSHESKELHITDTANCLWHVNERSPDTVKNFGNCAARQGLAVLSTFCKYEKVPVRLLLLWTLLFVVAETRHSDSDNKNDDTYNTESAKLITT